MAKLHQNTKGRRATEKGAASNQTGEKEEKQKQKTNNLTAWAMEIVRTEKGLRTHNIASLNAGAFRG